MADPANKSSFFRKHSWSLLPLTAAVVIGVTAMYVVISSKVRPSADTKTVSPSMRVLSLAKDFLRQNQPTEAVNVLRNYLASNWKDQEVRLRLVELYMKLGNLEQAQATLNEALAITPENADVFWVQGVLAMHKNLNPVIYFRRAAELPNASADILGNFGLYLLSEGQPEDAEDYLRRATESGAGNGEVYEKLGTILFLRKKIDEAYPLLMRATQLTPDNADAWAMLAEMQKNRNESEEATASLNMALTVARGEQRGVVLMEMARSRMTQSQWDQAAEMFAQATDYPSVQARASFLAAQCFYHTGAYAKAMHYIDRAAAAMPDNDAVFPWKQKIEAARFGQPTDDNQSAPSLLTIPPEEKSFRENAEQNETKYEDDDSPEA